MNAIVTSTTLTGKEHKKIIKNIESITTIRSDCLKIIDGSQNEHLIFIDTYTKIEIIDSIFGKYLQ